MERWWPTTPLMRPTHLTHHMPPAATEKSTQVVSTDVDFDAGIQSLNALQAAAYRLVGTATCQIEKANGRFVCRLVRLNDLQHGDTVDAETLRTRFLDLVTDENLRERLAEKTVGV